MTPIVSVFLLGLLASVDAVPSTGGVMTPEPAEAPYPDPTISELASWLQTAQDDLYIGQAAHNRRLISSPNQHQRMNEVGEEQGDGPSTGDAMTPDAAKPQYPWPDDATIARLREQFQRPINPSPPTEAEIIAVLMRMVEERQEEDTKLAHQQAEAAAATVKRIGTWLRPWISNTRDE